MTKCIGIDIGGTNFRIGVFEDTTLLSENRFEANFSTIFKTHAADQAWQTIVTSMADGIQKVIKQHPDIQHIGIGFPGFIDPVTKCISESPNLPGLKSVHLSQDLAAQLPADIQKIHVENDALAAAYGEYYATKTETASLIYFGLGTGVGGGLIICGMPFSGFHGMAMEVGHIIIEANGRQCGCGNQGCVEQYASASGVEYSYYQATTKQLNAHAVADCARNGDQAAKDAFTLAGQSLAIAVAHTLKVVDVPTVMIGGGMSLAWDLMEVAFNQTLNENLIPVLRGKIKVMTSQLNDTAGMLGAAQLALKPQH